MPTSGSTNWSLTARDVATFALRKLRVLAAGETMVAEDAELALENLNGMLKHWQISGPNLFRRTNGSVALVANQPSYTLAAAYRVTSARFRQAGRDLPMELLTSTEYEELPLKTSRGIPTSYYFDPQRASGLLYVWPVLAAVTTETIEYTYQRRYEDVDTLDDDLDVPQEWLETVGYNLASRLADDFGKDVPMVVGRAQALLMEAKAADREPVIRFEPARRWGMR